jgi:hypothetical protein
LFDCGGAQADIVRPKLLPLPQLSANAAFITAAAIVVAVAGETD